MNWQTHLPPEAAFLSSHLSLERVMVNREGTKILICFLSDQLVKEKEYLSLRGGFRKMFPQSAVSLRVCSPALSQNVREDIMQFAPFLIGCLSRTSPGLRPWLEGVRWSLQGETLSVSVASEAAFSYTKEVRLEQRLQKLMEDVFRMRLSVTVQSEEDKQSQRERLQLLEKRADEALKAEMGRFNQESKTAPEKNIESITDKNANNTLDRNGKNSPEINAQKTSEKNVRNGSRVYGNAIKESLTRMEDVGEDSGVIAIRGEVFSVQAKELRGGETRLVSFLMTDYTGSVHCKLFVRYRRKAPGMTDSAALSQAPSAQEAAKVAAVTDTIAEGCWLTVRGECQYDKFSRETVLMVSAIERAKAPSREDSAPQKRVELHLHTQMSNMDAVSSATALIRQAAEWGHPAVAVTDHGVVQAFPEAFAAAKKHQIKLIPGMEGYLIDEAAIVENPDDRPLSPVVVIDFETTGLSPRHDHIIEIGAVRLAGNEITGEFSMLIYPGIPIPPKITEITKITTAMVRDAKTFDQAAKELLAFIGDSALAAHNASFDTSFFKESLKRCGLTWNGPVIDTLAFARKAYPTLKSHKLGSVCRHLKISLKDAHRAVHDARATALLLTRMLAVARAKDVKTLKELNFAFSGGWAGSSHIVLLACSQKGMTNLNRIVSESHLRHFRMRPLIPRNLLQKNREGIIVGSACASGELFQAILEEKDDHELSRIARFYDYLEIQPIANNEYLLRSERVKSVEELQQINLKIVALGEKLGLPVVATGDVHFCKPEDAIARAILMAGKGFDEADAQPPLYLKTTDEMLDEFTYLGEEKAFEAVVKNPNKIATKIGEVRLFPRHPEGKETFQPFWEGAAETVKSACYREAHRRYGEVLPEIVSKRIEKELSSIIGFGFATLYLLAQKLVQKSMSDGYLVGSRGSIGSSFIATLCGITEINPLPPHYLCPKCGHCEFDELHEIATMGVDLPDKTCACGVMYQKDGYDIPFEVFLGFQGDKVPDVDLNFSGAYQSTAHQYVEALYGAGLVFRAGTIGTLAEKTAYGYVSKYLEERQKKASEAEKNRLVKKCVGAKRTTGQHPGGIVLLPKDYEIYEFTAIQRPADDVNSSVITTHYDFGSMHDVLVKLDILGHDDPTMLHMLEELTGVAPMSVPVNDPAVMSLFTGPDALGVTAADIRCPTGTLGIPEFGTSFVRSMLMTTKPKTIDGLIRISGLSHGIDVWVGNAETLIQSGVATLSECICARDDIMNYLMLRGMEPKTSFEIMESVRKGKGLTELFERAMEVASVPRWYIDSCKKIQYMFPKAHAAAYVLSALRIAWYKVYYPVAYYAAYFTVRADAFDISLMSRDANGLRDLLDGMEARNKELTAAEKEQFTLLEIALEMAARGISLLPISLYESDAEAFRLIDGKILPPFTAIPGLGLTAALSLCEARAPGPFLSMEDVKLRTKVSGTVMEALRAQAVFQGLAETSQVSLF